MIIVHDTFICKPGQASKVAKMFKDAMASDPATVNVMSDMTGQFNRIIMVSKYDDMAAFEANFKKYMEDSEENRKMKEKMQGFQDMYQSGGREIYKVW